MEANNILNKNISTLANDTLLGAETICPSDLVCVKADTGACGTKDMADICPLDETCKDDLCLTDGLECTSDCELDNICDCYDNPQPCIDTPTEILNFRVAKKIDLNEMAGRQIFTSNIYENIKYKDIPSPFTVKYQYQPYQLVRLQDISYNPIYLTFHNKANMYYNTIGATPIISLYKNNEKLVNIGTNESVTLELPNNDDYILWASPTSDNNIIMPEYQYCLEGIISGETTSMKFPIIYNGEIMSSDYGKTINDITSARTHFEFNIREYNAKDISTLFVNVEKLDTDHRVKVTCNYEYYLDRAYQTTPISTNSISSASASATPLTINIEPENYGYVTEAYPAYVYWTASNGSRVIRQYSSTGSGSSIINYFSQAINGKFTHNTTANTVTIYVSDAAPF